jgi:hypothetical protein
MGHENARKCPIGKRSPVSNAAQIVRIPRAKQLMRRGPARCLLKRRAMWVGGSVSKLLTGRFASTSPPTLMTHKVATAITNQCRSARLGSVILVWCQFQPPRLVCRVRAVRLSILLCQVSLPSPQNRTYTFQRIRLAGFALSIRLLSFSLPA